MLTQTIRDRLTPAIARSPVLINRYKKRSGWHQLPINNLDNFAKVSSQFSPFGLKFEGVVAIRPSNPRFSIDGYGVTVMPADQRQGLRIHLERPVSELSLWLMGSQVITISAFSDQGHCVTAVQTEAARNADTQTPYLEQHLTIRTRATKVIRIDSEAPFTLNRLAIKPRSRFMV